MRAQSAEPQCDLGPASASTRNSVDHKANSLDYHARAQAHAPKTKEEMRTAARQLADEGHGDYTISAILKIDVLGPRFQT